MMESSGNNREFSDRPPYVPLPSSVVGRPTESQGEITAPGGGTPEDIAAGSMAGAESTGPAAQNPAETPAAHRVAESHRPLPDIKELPEWNLLIGEDVQATPDAAAQEQPDISAEAKRTRLSDDCLREAYQGSQEKMPGLSAQDFAELQTFTQQAIGDETTFEAARYFMDVHDVGKSGRVRQAVGAGEHVDHDEVFRMLVCDPEHEAARQALLPTFDTLTPAGQDLIRHASAFQLNYPQVLQGETPAATLQGIHSEPDAQVREVDVLKSIFDIAGAAGHVNPDSSITMTSATWQRMKSLNAALRNPDLSSASDRYNAFLDMESQRLGSTAEAQNTQEQREARALARLGCHLRVETPEAFASLGRAFSGQPEQMKAIVTTELNRDGIDDRATLPYYGPKMLQELTKKYGNEFGLTYYGHVLQEAHIADKTARAAGETGVVMVELGDVVKDLITGKLDPHTTQLRFTEHDGVLVPHTIHPEITDMSLPVFEQGESLRGQRALIVGMGGGSDGIQAAAMRKVLKEKYGLEDAIVVSVRSAGRIVEHTGQAVGVATKEITPHTKPVGNWRFLENIPLEGDDPAQTFILNSTDPQVVESDLTALAAAAGAQVIIGLDTGGDSLYRTQHAGYSAANPADTTPDQDHQVLEGIAAIRVGRPDISTFSMVVATGVDSPPYACDVLDAAEATNIPLDSNDAERIKRQYAEWRMDGSGNDEGRYGKTPLAWLRALDGDTGVRVLDLPIANVVSETNPWRTVATVTPSMATVVIMDAEKHYQATQYQPDEPR